MRATVQRKWLSAVVRFGRGRKRPGTGLESSTVVPVDVKREVDVAGENDRGLKILTTNSGHSSP